MQITNLMGFFTPKEMEPYLSLISTEAYKTIKQEMNGINFSQSLNQK